MAQPAITFLSDYGLEDEFVGVCHGVIARLCPQARVIDLTHGIKRHDVRQGAMILAQSLPYLPVGVHLAVVDPGVGADRRAVAVALADGRTLVGPDNGLLSLAVEAGGGATEVVDIGGSQFCLRPVSATFHGRDIFAPVAAALAGGRELAEAGAVIAADDLSGLELPRPRHEGRDLVTHVLSVDGFGNIALDATGADLAALGLEPGGTVELELAVGARHRAVHGRTFADAACGALLLYVDARSQIALAVNQGNAATELGLSVDDDLRIRP